MTPDTPVSPEPAPEQPAQSAVTWKRVPVIAPGTYGGVEIAGGDPSSGGFVHVTMKRQAFSAPELRAAATLFAELADALEQKE